MFRVPSNIITGYSGANFFTGKKIPDHVHHLANGNAFCHIFGQEKICIHLLEKAYHGRGTAYNCQQCNLIPNDPIQLPEKTIALLNI